MYAVNLLEETGGEAGSIWIPILVLGWFLSMTFVGWQVNRRSAADGDPSQAADASHPGENPSEFDRH